MNILNKISEFIISNKKMFSIIFMALAIICVFMIPKINISYDLIEYLPEGETKYSIELMEKEFGVTNEANIYIEKIKLEDAKEIANKISGIEGIKTVVFNGNDDDYINFNALIFLMFDDLSSSQSSQNAMKTIDNYLIEYQYGMLGTGIMSNNLKNAISQQMPLIMAIALVIIFLVLLWTSNSYIEPILFLIVIGVSIVINLGTNALLTKVSFITNAICSIMQLAMAMDYAIILLHRFEEEKKNTDDFDKALSSALANSIKTLCGSSLTTIVGLIAITFMQFRLGYDLGIVLIKSIVCSLLTVFLFMPGMIALFHDKILKTSHKSFIPKFKILKTYIQKAKFMPIVMAIIIITSAVFASNVSYDFSITTLGQTCNKAYYETSQKVQNDFGSESLFVILIPKGYYDDENKLTKYLHSLDTDEKKIVKSIQSLSEYHVYDKLTAEEFADFYNIPIAESKIMYRYLGYDPMVPVLLDTLSDVLYYHRNDVILKNMSDEIVSVYNEKMYGKELLEGRDYSRVMVTFNFADDSQEAFDMVEKLRNDVNDYYSEFYVFGNTVNIYDIMQGFNSDNLKTSLITIIGIIIILLFNFKNLPISVLLIVVIESAIQINTCISVLINKPIFFCAKLIVDAILMGATIDYAILLTNRYTEARNSGMQTNESVEFAIDRSMATVLSSGLILVLAGFIIGFISTISVISDIGLLIGRGALISIILILILLPQLLILLDKVFVKIKKNETIK